MLVTLSQSVSGRELLSLMTSKRCGTLFPVSLGFSVTFNNSTTAETIASPSNDGLEVNGVVAVPTVYKIGGSNYFKIRDVAAMLNGTEKQFSVGYDGTKNAVTATTGQGYDKQSGDLAGAATGGSQTADPSNDAIYVDGQKINRRGVQN